MYGYRRMAPDERRAVVEQRQLREYPWHKPPHPDFGAGWYFISAACYEHRAHFGAPAELSDLERQLLEALRKAGLPLSAWVVMPNHYHPLLQAARMAEVGEALGPIHGRSGRYANRRDDTPGRRVWYKLSDRKVRSERHYWTCFHYILTNPVKHGYADQAADWPWSCHAETLAERGQTWIDDLQREYPLLDFGRDWDQ